MNISPFFQQLRSAYEAELDDLTSDSEGKNVLRQRLAEKRKELNFLIQMIELSPEMVAVIFHQGFRFTSPAVLEQLISHESDELPDWDSLTDAVQLTPWAQELAQVVLKAPMGGWLLTVAAALEYMYGKPDKRAAAPREDEDDTDESDEQDRHDALEDLDADDEKDARAREDAGADWMVEQGFDRKDR
jgi:hypothetical protein